MSDVPWSWARTAFISKDEDLERLKEAVRRAGRQGSVTDVSHPEL